MKKIKIKEELYWKLYNEEITVFSTNNDLKKRIEVSDTETIFNFISFLTEFRTMEEIYSYPILSAEDKDILLEFLRQKKYITTHWNYHQREHRLNKFVSSFPSTNYEDYLDKLKNLNVLILGLGTAGSYQIELLRKIGITNFTIIDGDVVEEKNVGAQNFYNTDIGKMKTEAIFERYISEKLVINRVSKYIKDYTHLKSTVDLSKYDFIINCADDYKLCLDIISKVFIDHPDTKLFLNGYSVLQQYTYKVVFKNYDSILIRLKKELEVKDNARHIATNSGSIFNAFFLTMSIGKMIFDDIYNIGNTTYASADFYQNNYYIGNTFDKFFYNEFEKVKKEQIKNINPAIVKKKRWISPISLKNIKEDKVLCTPQLSDKQQEFMLVDQDASFYNHCMNKKDDFKNYSDTNFNDIKELFLMYIKETFPIVVFEKVARALDNFQVYTDDTRFAKEKSFSRNLDSDLTIIYSVNNRGVSEQTNSIIHELFHLIYFSISNKTYEHELFVRRNHTQFLTRYRDEHKIRELAKSYIYESYNSLIGLYLTLEYEKHSLTNETSVFFDRHIEVNEDLGELLTVLENYIDPYEPLATCKYYLPLESDQSNLYQLEELINESVIEK